MISQLYIENIAVIEKTEIDFSMGFHVFTGETGAGKSIMIDALNAVLGGRITKDLVRSGAPKAFISATFVQLNEPTLNCLKDLGFSTDEEQLILSREISSEGKSVCRVNGRPCTVSNLKEIGQNLIDIYGQHDSQFLLKEERHISFLDDFGENEKLLSDYQQSYDQYVKIKREIDSISRDDAEKNRMIDLLTYQVQEIDDAQLEEGEEEELSGLKKRFQNSEKLAESLSQISSLLDGDEYSGGIRQNLQDLLETSSICEEFYPELASAMEEIQNLSYILDEYASDIHDKIDSLDVESIDINQIEARMDLIYRLKRKYGTTVSDILAFAETARADLNKLQTSEQRLEELQEELDLQYKLVLKKGKVLSEARKKAAQNLERNIIHELSFLNMPNVVFSVHQTDAPPTKSGMDSISFYFSPNAGESPKPISKIASGGELSRLMLALKSVTSQKENVSTMIFDEIDAGVSGLAAEKIGYKLRAVSENRQVLCVTHLAQIAAMGHHHYLIEKKSVKGRTITDVTLLTEEGRISELARIMGGSDPSPTVLSAAKELLQRHNT